MYDFLNGITKKIQAPTIINPFAGIDPLTGKPTAQPPAAPTGPFTDPMIFRNVFGSAIDSSLSGFMASKNPITMANQFVQSSAAPQIQGVNYLPTSIAPGTTVSAPAAPVMQPVAPMAPMVPAGQPAATPTQGTGMWASTNPAFQTAYEKNLTGMLTGSAYDPMRTQTQAGLAQYEKNQRAGTAATINRFGFTGQGIGQQVAGATEGQLAGNRFAANTGMDVAEQNMRQAGMDLATSYAQNQNVAAQNAFNNATLYGSDQDVMNAYKAMTGKDLDPMAVETYRGAARTLTQQAIDTGKQNLEKGALDINIAKNNEAWKAFNQAALYGSDQDVIDAYRTATGKDLDPMAVETYRGAARTMTQQQIDSNNVSIDTARTNLDVVRNSAGWSDFAKYVTTHTNTKTASDMELMSDPALVNFAQKIWEQSGQTGPVTAAFVRQQVTAVNDPKLTNEIVIWNTQIDEAVASGVMTAEDGKLLKDFVVGGMTQYLKRDPTTGKVTFDYAQYTKDTQASPSTVITNNNGTPATIPDDKKSTGSVFLSEGIVYEVGADGTAQALTYDPELDDPFGKTAEQIISQGKDGNAQYQVIMTARSGEMLSMMKNLSQFVGAKAETNSKVRFLNEAAPVWIPKTVTSGSSLPDISTLKEIPPTDTIFKYNGVLYCTTKISLDTKDGKSLQTITITNLLTGDTKNITLDEHEGDPIIPPPPPRDTRSW